MSCFALLGSNMYTYYLTSWSNFSGAAVLHGGLYQVTDCISCNGSESKVSECNTTCDVGMLQCCQTNASLEILCNKECDESSLVVEISLGAVAFLLLTLLVASCIVSVILGVKLKRASQQKQRYDVQQESHQYVEQQLGRWVVNYFILNEVIIQLSLCMRR